MQVRVVLFLNLTPVLLSWYYKNVITQFNGFFVLSLGSINSLLVWKVIISTVCGVSFPWNFHEGVVPYVFLLSISLLKCLDEKSLGLVSNHPKTLTGNYLPVVVWGFLSIASLMFVTYSISVINQIARKLKISVLLVPKEIIEAGNKKSQ